MTIDTFNSWDFKQKWRYLFKEPGADLIMFRSDSNSKYVLFDCNGFYAETISMINSKQISRIQAFPYEDSRMDLYLDYMKEFLSKTDEG